MVSSAALSKACTSTASLETELEDDFDTVSTGSSSSETVNNSVVLFDEPPKNQLAFGNVAITNSSDVHFGNKTYYQGPVTIKQFLYAGNADAALKGLESKVGDVKCGIDTNVDVDGESEVQQNGDCERVVDISQNGSVLAEEKPEIPAAAAGSDARLWCKKPYIVFGMGILLFILLSVTVLCSLLVKDNTQPLAIGAASDSGEQDKLLEQPNIDSSVNVTFPKKLKLVSRIEWIAQPPLEEANNLTLPVPYVIIAHTATESCTKTPLCVLIVRHIQSFHIESRHWWDIAYNFLVGGDGNAYVGRGWTKEGAHTYGYNYKSIGIAFIGTFTNVKPPAQQIAACKYLIEKGVELGYIAKDYKLLAARQLQATESPGQLLYEEMKSWDHWVQTLEV